MLDYIVSPNQSGDHSIVTFFMTGILMTAMSRNLHRGPQRSLAQAGLHRPSSLASFRSGSMLWDEYQPTSLIRFKPNTDTLIKWTIISCFIFLHFSSSGSGCERLSGQRELFPRGEYKTQNLQILRLPAPGCYCVNFQDTKKLSDNWIFHLYLRIFTSSASAEWEPIYIKM